MVSVAEASVGSGPDHREGVAVLVAENVDVALGVEAQIVQIDARPRAASAKQETLWVRCLSPVPGLAWPVQDDHPERGWIFFFVRQDLAPGQVGPGRRARRHRPYSPAAFRRSPSATLGMFDAACEPDH